jgi:hypothetical protein
MDKSLDQNTGILDVQPASPILEWVEWAGTKKARRSRPASYKSLIA